MSKKKSKNAMDMLNEFFPEEFTPGKMIKAKRTNYKITLDEVEKVTGISKTNLSLYEHDKKPLGLIQATKIGIAIGLHPMSILFPNGYEKSSQFKEIIEKSKKLLNKKIPIGKKSA